MNLTEEGLRQIEHYADKKKDVSIMFQVQILRELREFRALFEQAKDSVVERVTINTFIGGQRYEKIKENIKKENPKV